MKMEVLVCAVVAVALVHGLFAYDGEAWRYANLDSQIKQLDVGLSQAMESVACAGAELRSTYVNNRYCCEQLDAAWKELICASNVIAQVKINLRGQDEKLMKWQCGTIIFIVFVLCIVGVVLLMVKATQKRPSVAPTEDDGHPRCPRCGWKYNKGETKCKKCGTRF